MTDILRELSQRLPVMSKSHQRIANYILSHLKDASFFTVQDLARCCETSTTTVIRFTQQMGFSGYSDFLKHLRMDSLSQPGIINRFTQILSESSQDQLFHQTLTGDIGNINLTMLELSQDDFRKAVELIARTPRVFVMGLRESFSMAHYMLSRLEPIRRNVFQLQSSGGSYIDQIISLNKGDLCIYFAFHVYTRASLQMLEVLHRRGVQVVLFTNPPTDPVREFADIVFSCHVQGISYKNSYAAPLTLINYLSNAVAVLDSPTSMQNLKEFDQIMFDHKIYY